MNFQGEKLFQKKESAHGKTTEVNTHNCLLNTMLISWIIFTHQVISPNIPILQMWKLTSVKKKKV